jgi:hypothetical protein
MAGCQSESQQASQKSTVFESGQHGKTLNTYNGANTTLVSNFFGLDSMLYIFFAQPSLVQQLFIQIF